MKLAAALAGLLLAASPGATSLSRAVAFLDSRGQPSGGFAEPGQAADPSLTAWVALGLRASGANAGPRAGEYLERNEDALRGATDVALSALARSALGAKPSRLLARLRALERPSGAVGPSVNSTIWAVLAFRQARESIPPRAARYVLSVQTRAGGWGWARGVAPDSNDTAAAIQALRAVRITGRPIARGLAFLRRCRNRDGGFGLAPRRPSDAQSTAWAIQAFLAAGRQPPRGSLAYLRRLQRPDGSFRYSARYVTTPVWVTAQVTPALARKPFPLR